MDNKPETNAQEFEYRAEMKQLLHIIVHSLYTHPEVFLRELISNASDALNKVRFRRLTDPNIIDPDAELRININVDKENKIFSIEDTGIGMTKQELVEQIGTIASSGTLQFLKKAAEEKKNIDGQLIGQFGVGFYSVFMVTDEVTIETRNAYPASIAYRWKSIGEDKFSIEEIDRQSRGTKIYFRLKDEYEEFYEPEKIKSVLKKYSNFVDFPVYVNNERVNIVSAIWHRKKDEIKEEELNEFYKFLSNDFEPPLGHIHLNIEGNLNFRALLFIPQSAPPMLFREPVEKSLHLYSRKVFIQDDAKELMPEYLRFVKGVVDTEDLPLNVSREATQSSPVMAKIRNVLTGKILSLLEDWAENDKGKYEKFWNAFGTMMKMGVASDYTNKKRIVELLRYESSASEKGTLTSLKEYVSRMQESQKDIYYVLADHRDLIERNPNMEYFRKKGIEVLFMTDPIDVFTIPHIFDYEGKQLKSIEKADIDIHEEISKEEALSDEQSKTLVSMFKEVLGDKVEDVAVSKRLVDSPVTLVVSSQGLDPQMEKMFQMLEKDYSVSKRILEINPAHPIIKNIMTLTIADSKNPLISKSIVQLYESALLIEGYLKSPGEFIGRMFEIMEQATKS